MVRCCSVLLIVLLGIASSPDALKVPDPIPNERGTTVTAETNGKPRATAEWTMEPANANGHPAVRFTETGSGRYSPFQTPVNWTIEAIWQADGSYKPLTFDKTFRDAGGKILATEKKTFDLARPSVRFERKPANGKAETKLLTTTADTIAAEGIAGVLRSIPFDSGRPFPLHMLSNEPKLYDVTLETRGREKLHTALGDIECYKVELVPHLGLLNLVKVFFPKTYLWFSVAPPHFWVRYEGLEAGFGTAQVVVELKTYSGKVPEGRQSVATGVSPW